MNKKTVLGDMLVIVVISFLLAAALNISSIVRLVVDQDSPASDPSAQTLERRCSDLEERQQALGERIKVLEWQMTWK